MTELEKEFSAKIFANEMRKYCMLGLFYYGGA